VQRLFPMSRVDDVLAGFYVEDDGRVNPVDATMAFAKGARGTGARIVELMFGMAERAGTTLMLITHDSAIAHRCDRVLRMVDGRVEEETPLAQASSA
ncbi:MAG: hypothetical protein VXW49_11615, partial [Pseudomonadota bacterium]|nr:hypothetical protein [Pseudomonadota bacterium]